MKVFAILAAGVFFGAAVLIQFPQLGEGEEEPVAETATLHETLTPHTSYRPLLSTSESVPTETPSKRLPSVVGLWRHEGSILDGMGTSANKYKDVRMESNLTIIADGSFLDRIKVVYDPVWTYFTGRFGVTYVYSGKWTIDADAKNLVLNAARVDVIAVEGKLTMQAAIEEYKLTQKLREMSIQSLSRTKMVCDDASFDFEYRRVPSY